MNDETQTDSGDEIETELIEERLYSEEGVEGMLVEQLYQTSGKEWFLVRGRSDMLRGKEFAAAEVLQRAIELVKANPPANLPAVGTVEFEKIKSLLAAHLADVQKITRPDIEDPQIVALEPHEAWGWLEDHAESDRARMALEDFMLEGDTSQEDPTDVEVQLLRPLKTTN
jgi:hypothetical protein